MLKWYLSTFPDVYELRVFPTHYYVLSIFEGRMDICMGCYDMKTIIRGFLLGKHNGIERGADYA